MSAPTRSDAPTHAKPSGHPQTSAQPPPAFQTTLVKSGDEWEKAGRARDHFCEGPDVGTHIECSSLTRPWKMKDHMGSKSQAVCLWSTHFTSLCQGVFHLHLELRKHNNYLRGIN